MASVRSAGEAVARVAYLCSDVVVCVQPSLAIDSDFSPQLHSFATFKTSNVVSQQPTDVVTVRQHADPLLSVFQPAKSGKLVSVTTDSSILIQSIPHLYQLANFPVVIHVSLQSARSTDYSEITAIRQCGFTFLQSESLQEAQDLAITAHALAGRSGKGVIHFFDSSNSATSTPIQQEQTAVLEQVVASSVSSSRQTAEQDVSGIYADSVKIVASRAESTLPNPTHPTIPLKPTTSSDIQVSGGDSSGSTSRRDSNTDKESVTSSMTSAQSIQEAKAVSSEDILRIVNAVWSEINAATGRLYQPFNYVGPTTAETVLFAFGADAALLGEEMGAAKDDDTYAGAGLLTVRLYRPWIGAALAEYLPRTVRKIAVLEQIRRKTTKWGPLLLDLLTALNVGASGASAPQIVGYQLGHLEPSTIRQALNGIFSNLNSQTPVQNLEVGISSTETQISQTQAHEHEQPRVENAYMKILSQVFNSKLHVANRLGTHDAGISSRVAANPEFGFGSLVARMEKRKAFVREVQEAAKSRDFVTDTPQKWLSNWALNAENPSKCDAAAQEAISRLSNDGSSLASKLLASKAFFSKESQWLIGSDAWAYDLGNSGVHHVLASGQNVNMLIIDSQPYSERVAADASRRKKDIGLYAMNYGNAYVASVAVYGSYTQVLEAMIEADKFNGPSIVLAYLPYNNENDSPVTVLQETKRAVDLGYWPLYRWTPSSGENEPVFNLDSSRIRLELQEFLRRDNQLTQLMKRQPDFAANLAGSYGTEVRALQKRQAKDAYSKLLDSLFGAPMTVLYASDNGNAENLAKRLTNRGKARGLKSMVMAMDDYPLEDLATEENVVFLTATAGQGEFPQNGRSFWENVKTSVDIDLANVNFAVFALGDSHYWPRKEDKHYYNKPGKDLYAKLTALGGKSMVDCGMGDDQDPDGYQTGYADWEPKLWQALGVDKVEGLPEEPPPMTNEDIKIQSNFLRGTIAEGLKDTSTGAIAAGDQQLTKFHGTYMQDDRDLRDERKAQGLEPAYAFMIRCRLNGGVATAEQWMQMDAISSNLGNETMKLTTRQTFQFHGVVKGKLRPAMQAINAALMTTLAACGDVNRNVMCSSLPEQSQYHADVHAVSARISDHLLPRTAAYHEIWLKDEDDKKVQLAGNAVVDEEPLYGPVYLPRKYKITIAIPPHNDTDVYAHDVGLIAIKDGAGRLEGFNILAGGGMGVTHNNKKTYPRTGSMLGYCAADQAHIVCEKIMLVQRDNGDRTNRKHARLKYTIDDMGVDVFRSKVEELWGQQFAEQRPFHFDSNIDTFGWVKDERGLNHFTMFIENGRIEDTAEFPMKTGLREIAKVHKGEFRLTGNQHLILSNVADEDLAAMKDLLARYKLDNVSQSAVRLSSSACVAFPTCGLAMAESERYLPEFLTKVEKIMEDNGLRQDSIVMRMTGCPNGCARPWLSEWGMVGLAYGTYNLYLGGGYHGQRLNKLYKRGITGDEAIELFKPMIKRYALERNNGERFGDWVIRAGYVKATTEGKTFHDDVVDPDDEE